MLKELVTAAWMAFTPADTIETDVESMFEVVREHGQVTHDTANVRFGKVDGDKIVYHLDDCSVLTTPEDYLGKKTATYACDSLEIMKYDIGSKENGSLYKGKGILFFEFGQALDGTLIEFITDRDIDGDVDNCLDIFWKDGNEPRMTRRNRIYCINDYAAHADRLARFQEYLARKND